MSQNKQNKKEKEVSGQSPCLGMKEIRESGFLP